MLLILVTIAIVLPLAGVVGVVISEIRGLTPHILSALEHGEGLWASLTSTLAPEANTGASSSTHSLFGGNIGNNIRTMFSTYGAEIGSILLRIAKASTHAVLSLVLFGVTLYTFLVERELAYRWLQ